MLSALLFIPEASQSIDVYGKVGVADLDESFVASATDTRAAAGCRPFSSSIEQSDSAPYVGFGGRFKIAREFALRVEYEAIDRDGGDPIAMLSLGIAVEF